jgi:chromosome segregation ATPase
MMNFLIVLAHNGACYQKQRVEPGWKVSQLCESLCRELEWPITITQRDIILFTKNGTQLAQDGKFVDYQAEVETDKKEISELFLFSRKELPSESREVKFKPDQKIETKSLPHDHKTNHSIMNGLYTTLQIMLNRSGQFGEKTLVLRHAALQCIDELNAQHRALTAVSLNLSEFLTKLRAALEKLVKTVAVEKGQFEAAFPQSNVETMLERLSVQLHPALQKENKTTLLDFADKKKVTCAFQDCKQQFDTLPGKLSKLSESVRELCADTKLTIPSPQNEDYPALRERLACVNHEQENLQTLQSIVSDVFVLWEEENLEVGHLPSIHERSRKLLSSFKGSYDELLQEYTQLSRQRVSYQASYRAFMERVACAHTLINTFQKKLVSYDQAFSYYASKRQRLLALKSLPTFYARVLPEVQRRRHFEQQFLQQFTTFQQFMSQVTRTENVVRDAFSSSFPHLPRSFLPELTDRPSYSHSLTSSRPLPDLSQAEDPGASSPSLAAFVPAADAFVSVRLDHDQCKRDKHRLETTLKQTHQKELTSLRADMAVETASAAERLRAMEVRAMDAEARVLEQQKELEQQLKSAHGSLMETQDQLKKTQDQLKETQDQLKAKQDHVEALERTVKYTQHRLDLSNACIASLETEKHSLTESFTQKESLLEAMTRSHQEEIQEITQDKNRFSNQLTACKADFKRCEEKQLHDFNEMKERTVALQQDVARLTKCNDACRKENQQLTADMQAMSIHACCLLVKYNRLREIHRIAE